jgi:hypothetical protein
MIQRLQTLWLLLATACMALTFKFKFAAGFKIDNAVKIPKNVLAGTNIISSVAAIAFMAIALYSIFLYNNRKLQLRIVAINIVTALVTFYGLYSQTTPLTDTTYAISGILPVFALGFTISALHCTWQDQKKINDLNSNRLR